MTDFDLRNAIVRVQDGTGFIISETGLILTAAHNIISPQEQKRGKIAPVGYQVAISFLKIGEAFQTETQTFPAKVCYWLASEEGDIAVLQLDIPLPRGVEILKLAQPKEGNSFKVVGFPESPVDGEEAIGIIGGEYSYNGFQLHKASTIRGGFSGGPVYDTAQGMAVGFVSFIPGRIDLKNFENAFAVSASFIAEKYPAIKLHESKKTKKMTYEEFKKLLEEQSIGEGFEVLDDYYNAMSSGDKTSYNTLKRERKSDKLGILEDNQKDRLKLIAKKYLA